MEGFLDSYDLPILNQDEINRLRRSITRNEIQTVIIKSSSTKGKWSETCGNTEELHQNLNLLFKLFYA